MSSFALHPALWQLLCRQGISKVRKLRRNFSSRRRMILTLVAIALAALWIMNAVATILYRERYDPESFHRWMSLLLVLYFLWHVIRIAYKRPEEAIEWTPSEQEFLCGGPFSRRELLMYRLTVILTATLPKAVLASLLLWPDLPMWWSGFVGLLVGLVLLEYLRLIMETLAAGVRRRTYLVARGVVFGGVVLIAGGGLWHTLQTRSPEQLEELGLLKEWGLTLEGLLATWPGRLLEAPFVIVGEVITASGLSWLLAGQIAISIGMVVAAAYSAVRLDGYFHRRMWLAGFTDAPSEAGAAAARDDELHQPSRLPAIPALKGFGPVAWRQLKAVKRYAGSLAVAMGVPAVLACLPMMIPAAPATTFLRVVACVVFYSFVLLPSALKFDFRRDFDRLPILKMLPIRPTALVLGQVTAPILLAVGFQSTVVLFAAAVQPVSSSLVIGALLLLVPVTIFFVALDNLIFLLYPHRISQEGLEVFLRSTLTFTAKAVLLGLAAALVVTWVTYARVIANLIGSPGSIQMIFAIGVGCMTLAGALFTLYLLISAFERFDPSLDPAG